MSSDGVPQQTHGTASARPVRRRNRLTATTPDAAAGAITQGVTSNATDLTARGDNAFLTTFPYLGTPYSGYEAGTNAA